MQGVPGGSARITFSVRTLARRSSAASKEVTQLIAGPGEDIQRDTCFFQKALSAMAEIIQAVDRVTQSMGEVFVAPVAEQ